MHREQCAAHNDCRTTNGGREPAVVSETRLRWRCESTRNESRRARGASARRGFPDRICKCNAMNFRVSSSYAECAPRGAYAPRSWSGMRALRESCIFQLQVRPEHRCARERAQHICVLHLRTRYVHHGWRTPSAPGLGCTVPVRRRKRQPRCAPNFAAKSDIRAAQTHVHKSGGRQPAVVFRTASASAMRRISAFRTRMRQCTPRGAYAPRSWLHARHIACDMRFRFATADVSHGGLTPPALGRECVRWANYAYSSCKFDRNIAASGNAPSTHAYSSCGFDTFTTGGLRPRSWLHGAGLAHQTRNAQKERRT
jgi:hypothetical protein